MNIKDLIAEGEEIYATKYKYISSSSPTIKEMRTVGYNSNEGVEFVNCDKKTAWEQKCSVFLHEKFPNHPKVEGFGRLCTQTRHSNNRASVCWQQISILKAFAEINPVTQTTDYESVLSNIFNKFQKVEQQLARRYNSRETLRIDDEYDVQNLLHSLLRLYFDDIRPEEYTPSYAGSSTRMDFLLNDDQIVIEVKKTRSGLNDKKVGEELTLDIAHYKAHPKCKKIYCFVYDKDCFISNPRGIENDLEKQSTPEMTVKVFIRPE